MIDDESVAQLIRTTLHTKPADGATHWSVRSVLPRPAFPRAVSSATSNSSGCSRTSTEGFKLSNDPFFIEKLRDVVGLYLSPPENALVLCVDEKSQCQALERTQPMLPMGFGYVEGVTHDYVRHGTTTLFAALNMLNGAVLMTCKERHRLGIPVVHCARDFSPPFPPLFPPPPPPPPPRQVGACRSQGIHCIVDNYATHSHPKVKAWLATRPRWHMHFIPTYSSWLNQVERFFALITDKAIRRGSFTSVKQLVQRIDHFVASHNEKCQPFRWTATADSILEKLHRLCSRITGTAH